MPRKHLTHAPCDDYGARPGSRVPPVCPFGSTACCEEQCILWLKGETCMVRLALFGLIVAGSDKVGITHLLINAHKQMRS